MQTSRPRQIIVLSRRAMTSLLHLLLELNECKCAPAGTRFQYTFTVGVFVQTKLKIFLSITNTSLGLFLLRRLLFLREIPESRILVGKKISKESFCSMNVNAIPQLNPILNIGKVVACRLTSCHPLWKFQCLYLLEEKPSITSTL